MAKEYLFGPCKPVEIVQGLLLIARWIRCAVELGLHGALPRLSRRRNVGVGVESMSENEKALIIGASSWCELMFS
ncbi:hypothetical protein BDV93DRAFT_528201, partial [Ceratobasidium sp. AG-I]